MAGGQFRSKVSANLSADILEMEIMPDHVHMLLEVNPQFGIHKLLDQIAGICSKSEGSSDVTDLSWKTSQRKRYGRKATIRSFPESRGLAVSRILQSVYEKIAKERQIEFLPAAAYVHCCEADQEHLNASGHKELLRK